MNNGNNVNYSINTLAIDSIIIKIMDLGEEIKGQFNRMDELMDKVSTIYECEGATVLKNKYMMFRENYPTIITNLLSYSADLVSLKKKYKTNTEILVEDLLKARARLAQVTAYKEER